VKPKRLEKLSDVTFSRLDLEAQAHIVGGTTYMGRLTGPFTSPEPGGPADGPKLDIIQDV